MLTTSTISSLEARRTSFSRGQEALLAVADASVHLGRLEELAEALAVVHSRKADAADER